MSAVPTSADIEAIRRRDYERRHSPFIVGGGQAIEDRRALLAALDGERRHRADLEAENARLREVLAPSDDPLHNSVIAIMESWLAHVKEQNAQRADLERQLEEARELIAERFPMDAYDRWSRDGNRADAETMDAWYADRRAWLNNVGPVVAGRNDGESV